MLKERAHKQIGRHLDEDEDAVSQLDWDLVLDRVQAVQAFYLENSDRLTFLAAAERGQGNLPLP